MANQTNPHAVLAHAAAQVLAQGNLAPAVKSQIVHAWATHCIALLKGSRQ